MPDTKYTAAGSGELSAYLALPARGPGRGPELS